jgi:hypothetical protein
MEYSAFVLMQLRGTLHFNKPFGSWNFSGRPPGKPDLDPKSYH